MAKGHRQGGKIGGRHTSVIPAAEKLVDFLQREPAVNKISIGYIKHGIGGGKHSIKTSLRDGSLFIKIRGTASIQEIHVYTDTPEDVQSAIKEFADDAHYLYSAG